MKLLTFKRVVQLDDSRRFLICAKMHLPTIIEQGFAPDDVIDRIIHDITVVAAKSSDIKIVAVTDPSE